MDNNGTIIFTIGRMNPPTSGHMKLIETMITLAIENNENNIYIILSNTQDNKKNPLDCNTKKTFLTQYGMIDHVKRSMMELPSNINAIESINIHIFCMNDSVDDETKCGKHPILKHICNIIQTRPDARQLLLVIGEDRASSYNFINTDIGTKYPTIEFNTHAVSRPEGAISATYIRGLVENNNEEQFMEEAAKTGLSPENSNMLYTLIQQGLQDKPTESKRRKITHNGGKQKYIKVNKTRKYSRHKHTCKHKHTCRHKHNNKKFYKK